MRRRARHLSLALAALAVGVAAAFAVSVGAAAPNSASINAVDYQFEVAGQPGVSSATIAAGGTVTFSYPSGGSFHNVHFLGTQPTSCTQTAGPVLGSVPPLPAQPAGAGWSGNCTFNTAGTYTFVCDAHPSMTGSLEVVGENDPGSTTPTGPPPGPGTPVVTVPRRQRSTVIRGSVTTPGGPSLVVVTALVSNRALTKRRPKRVRKVRIGSQRKRSTGTGTTTFAVKLTAPARRGLRRRKRLPIQLRIAVTPAGGRADTRTIRVVLTAPA